MKFEAVLLQVIPEQKPAWAAIDKGDLGAFRAFLMLLYGPLVSKFDNGDLQSRREYFFERAWAPIFTKGNKRAIKGLRIILRFCKTGDLIPLDFLSDLKGLVSNNGSKPQIRKLVDDCLTIFFPKQACCGE